MLRQGATVANEQGSFTTPSFVSFTDEERLIGESAKNQAAMNPANTIFDIKYVSNQGAGQDRHHDKRTDRLQAVDWEKVRRPHCKEGYHIMAFQGRRPGW